MNRNRRHRTNPSSPLVEERLAHYRTALDTATDAHPVLRPASAPGWTLGADAGRSGPGPRARVALVGATLAVFALVGVVALRIGTEPTDQAANTATANIGAANTGAPAGEGPAPTGSEHPTGTDPAGPDPTGTDPAGTDPADTDPTGTTMTAMANPDWPEVCESRGPAPTLALAVPGGLDLAVPGFIFSRPASEEAIEVEFISRALVGYDCFGRVLPPIEPRPGDTPGSTLWVVRPPGGTEDVALTVRVESRGDVVGVVELRGSTDFAVMEGAEPADTLLVFHGPLPPGSAWAQISFKQGGEVWSVTGGVDGPTALQPHPDETHHPDRTAPIEWVLFTIGDATGIVLDAGGLVLDRAS